MKHIIILTVALLAMTNLFSQTIIDPPALHDHYTVFKNANIFDTNSVYKSFIRGWNWGKPSRKLDDAMYINFPPCSQALLGNTATAATPTYHSAILYKMNDLVAFNITE